MVSSQNTGIKGEELALSFLTGLGYRLMERNYRCRFGEVDLIMQDGEELVFIEVKTRRSTKYGMPQDAVGAVKQKKIRRLAVQYMMYRRKEEYQPRFDVIAITIDRAGNPTIDHFKNAF